MADTLSGKTLFITGASRGIGLAIARRCARDAANVAIAAKTAEPNPKLPGTIYSAATAIQKPAAKPLPPPLPLPPTHQSASGDEAAQRARPVAGLATTHPSGPAGPEDFAQGGDRLRRQLPDGRHLPVGERGAGFRPVSERPGR